MTENVLEIEGLRVHFDTLDGPIEALHSVDLEVKDKQIMGLVGESGCGKSVTALAWKAGLTMEMAVNLQKTIGRIKPDKVLEAGADGGYPLSEDDIEWYMESFFA